MNVQILKDNVTSPKAGGTVHRGRKDGAILQEIFLVNWNWTKFTLLNRCNQYFLTEIKFAAARTYRSQQRIIPCSSQETSILSFERVRLQYRQQQVNVSRETHIPQQTQSIET